MAPPRYSPRSETASKVMAVPKSRMMHGPPYLSNAATALTTRSAPTSRGLSQRMGIPVMGPGSTNSGARPK